MRKLKNSKLSKKTKMYLLIYIFFCRINDLQLQERRNRQFYESQIKELKEKKTRKSADEKPIVRCPESCKVKKIQIENENNKLRRDLMLMEETKQNLEKLLYEQNLEVSLMQICLNKNFILKFFSF
jgi:hypothetical protein